MLKDINMATNAELEKEKETLYEDFEKVKAELYNKYVSLQNLSEQYERVIEEINKRNGKANG